MNGGGRRKGLRMEGGLIQSVNGTDSCRLYPRGTHLCVCPLIPRFECEKALAVRKICNAASRIVTAVLCQVPLHMYARA